VTTRDLLGAHMSIAGGLHRALERGQAVGCSVVQIFLKNQMQWNARPLTEADVRLWTAARRATGIHTAFAHASYLVNLGTPVDAEWRHAIAAFHDELERAEALGLPFVVIHPGSHKGAGLEAGLARVAAALDELTRRTAGYRVRIVLENTAGAGDTIGRTFGELAALLEGARAAERLGVCLDTCHLFAAGYDIRRRAGYERVMAECERALGVSTIRAFHLNDARAGLGSGLDRHTHIGQGQLGLAPFRFLLNDPRWRRVPKALETPKEPEPAADIANLRTLRRLIARR
jgi:deoxyribonuclease-4